MATKKEIKEILKSLSLTETDMDNFWEELKETNWIVKNLTKYGKTWRDMNGSVIKTLPTQKQKDIESAELKRREEEEKAAAELKTKQEEDYKSAHYDEILLHKIDSGEKLDEKECLI